MKESNGAPLYADPNQPLNARVADLLARMTLEEKVSQMVHGAAEVPRLGVPSYNWWNECLHGVARAGIATVFPQAIGMAASFDPALLNRVAHATSDEARAKHHEALRRGDRRIYKGLTFWSPNVNIFRDPRWGRGQETYGEDPYLTGRLGVAFVKGLQGDDPRYLKLVATPKHFAAHSGPEALRHHFDAHVSPKDMRETYLPAFFDCVVEGKAASVMGAYNRTNGEPCCASPTLLARMLRQEWGFDGYVVSDCGAIADIHLHHTVTSSAARSAALAVKAGCDLECGQVYPALVDAVREGLITEEEIDLSLGRLLRARFSLGMFDPPERVPYASIAYEVVDSPAHAGLALEMARESLVLLKNQDRLLPLPPGVKRIAVIGPTADSRDVLLGNYSGTPSRPVTILDGIRQIAPAGAQIRYAPGSHISKDLDGYWGDRPDDGFAEAASAAARADVVVMCLGLGPSLEGEEDRDDPSEMKGDRLRIELPRIQQKLLEHVHAVGTPIVLVLTGGSPLAVTWAQDHVPAILMAWYPGQAGGIAVAEALFGRFSPGGRLPITFVRSVDQLPPFTDYSMSGRTYRFLESTPLYPFGYGLSYSPFRYDSLTLSAASVPAGREVGVTVRVTNTGTVEADEVAQLYLSDLESSTRVPRWQLAGFRRLRLAPGQSEVVQLTITPRQMSVIGDDGSRVLEPGKFRVYLGGSQPDERSHELTGARPLSAELTVTGAALRMRY
ncbi:MAG TPA: glycoside hydrolase family 3 C-terminal domain-containing protein [Spirochaetia bacterium]|nr:glycoside hydrolase family 3 C-terminal domain-containing protein [Spirochaetia bacterium]